jgi:hypothetical protein
MAAPPANDLALSAIGLNTTMVQRQFETAANRFYPTGLLLLSLLSFGGAVLCAGSLWWLRRRY